MTEEQWVAKWKEVAKVIRKDFPDIPEAKEDLEMIDSYVEKGERISSRRRSSRSSTAETESYRITEMMINHRDLMVSQLLQL